MMKLSDIKIKESFANTTPSEEKMNECRYNMDELEAIEWLKQIKNRYIHGGDEFYDLMRRKAIDRAIKSLEKEYETKKY